jgi:hypothetical protein
MLAMWFSAAFAIFFTVAAALSCVGVMGTEGDTLDALLMGAGGAVVSGASWAALRYFT